MRAMRDEDIERENLSFESFEFLASQEIGALRVYGGGERVFHREPESVATKIVHAGAELRSPRAGAQFVAGIDLKASELHDWSPATSGSPSETSMWIARSVTGSMRVASLRSMGATEIGSGFRIT